MTIKTLLGLTALLFALSTAPLPASADAPDSGDFASFGVQWTPPQNLKYQWPIYRGYVAAYDVSNPSDKSTASVRIQLEPAGHKTLADFSEEIVKTSNAQVISDPPKIGDSPSSKLIFTVPSARYHVQTLYVVVHEDRKYIFSALCSGNADQAESTALAVLESIVASVKFVAPRSPRDLVAEDLLPPFRYERELNVSLPTAMRTVNPPGKPPLFVLTDYATGSSPLMLTIDIARGVDASLEDETFPTRFASGLRKSLKTDDDPVFTAASNEPRLLLSQVLHTSTEKNGVTTRKSVQVAVGFFHADHQVVVMIFSITDEDRSHEKDYLQLAQQILDSVRIVTPPKRIATPPAPAGGTPSATSPKP